MPKRRDAEHIKCVVLVIRDRRDLDTAELVDQLRHSIAVPDDQHAAALMLAHDPRHEALRIGGWDDDRLLTEALRERSRGLLRPPGITDVDGVDPPHSLAATKHLRKPLGALL